MSENNIRTLNDLRILQALPLDIKVMKTKQRIKEWVDYYGLENVCVSFSGGKDSTVLLNIAREMYPDIEAMFVNTGLEYPEIQRFVKSFNNVTILRPKMMFIDVIKKYGYPIVSKNVSECVEQARFSLNKINGKSNYRLLKIQGRALDKNGNKSLYNIEKYSPLLKAPFRISSKCCNVMKKNVAKTYDKKYITAQLADESNIRKQKWIQNGCNGFNMKKPISNPMSFWLEQDVLQYIKNNNIEISSVYGDIVYVDKKNNQCDNCLISDCKLKCTGCHRTGCIFCAFGSHHDERFIDLKKTHIKQYEFCINGGDFDKDGMWSPNEKGLGMGYVFDWCNHNIKNFCVKY